MHSLAFPPLNPCMYELQSSVIPDTLLAKNNNENDSDNDIKMLLVTNLLSSQPHRKEFYWNGTKSSTNTQKQDMVLYSKIFCSKIDISCDVCLSLSLYLVSDKGSFVQVKTACGWLTRHLLLLRKQVHGTMNTFDAVYLLFTFVTRLVGVNLSIFNIKWLPLKLNPVITWTIAAETSPFCKCFQKNTLISTSPQKYQVWWLNYLKLSMYWT